MASELWKLRGRRPVLWTIPILVEVVSQRPLTYRFAHAMELSFAQENAFAAQCRELCAWTEEAHPGQWFVRAVDLAVHADPQPPQHPELLFSWEQPRLSQQPQTDPALRADRDEFLDALWQSNETGVQSREELERLWRLFCTHAANWLINQEKPVDFFLFQLHVCPYRVNWKEILHKKFPELGPWMREAEWAEQQRMLHTGRVYEDFCSLDLVAVGSGLLDRGIEVELKPSWFKQTRRVEFERRAQLGFREYAERIVGSLRRRVSISLRIFMAWYTGARRPSAADFKGRLHGDIRVLGDFSKPPVLASRRVKAALDAAILPGPAPQSPTQPIGEHPVPAPSPLPSLPALQQIPQDVRHTWPNLCGPERQPPPPGLLVPAPAQEPDPV